MNTWICNTTGEAIFEFPDEGTVEDYLKRNGLYPSSTYFFLGTQPRYLSGDEFGGDANEATETQSMCTAERSSVMALSVPVPTTKSSDEDVCKVCSCTFEKGQNCLRCEQNSEYQKSIWADSVEIAPQELQSENFISPVSMEEMREFRLAHFQITISCPPVQDNIAATSGVFHGEGNSSQEPTCDVPSEPDPPAQVITATSRALREEESPLPGPTSGITSEQGERGVMSLTVHRSVICSDMIEHHEL